MSISDEPDASTEDPPSDQEPFDPLAEACPECLAEPGEACQWSCSSNWHD